MADEIIEEEIVEEDFLDEEIDDNTEDDFDEDSDEEDSIEDDNSDEEGDKDLDEFDELFAEDEEFSIEKLELDKIEGYNDSEEDKKAIEKLGNEIFKLGVKGKQVKPVIELIGGILKNVHETVEGKISKDTYNKMSVESRTNYKLLVNTAKTVLSKEEMDMFAKVFNNESKIKLLTKITGTKTSRTGKTDYEDGGRRQLNGTMTYDRFDERIQNITVKYMKTPEIEKKALQKLYKEASNSSDNDIREYIKNNPL